MKQICFDPRDPDYDGPDDDEELEALKDAWYGTDEESESSWPDDIGEPWEYSFDNPADDYIMAEAELRGHL